MGFSLMCLFVNLLMPVVCGHWFWVCEWVLVDADADANADVLLLGLWVLLMVSGW